MLVTEMASLRGSVEEVKAIKEKDVPLQKVLEVVVQECKLQVAVEEVKDSLQNETAVLPGALKEAMATERRMYS